MSSESGSGKAISDNQNGPTWVPMMVPNHAPRIPQAEWEKHKAQIVSQYVQQSMPLSQVREMMGKAPHNFRATTRQYVHQLGKWGIEKYNTKPKSRGPKRAQRRSEDEDNVQDSSKSVNNSSLPTEGQSPMPEGAYSLSHSVTMHPIFARQPTPPQLRVPFEPESGMNPAVKQAVPMETTSGTFSALSAGEWKRPQHVDVSMENENLACPFRKRNPLRFNIRDHQSCVIHSFPDISQIKRHVRVYHQRKAPPAFECPRCEAPFTLAVDLKAHLAVPVDQICQLKVSAAPSDPAHPDPEDGIDANIEETLTGRRANTKVITWEMLWRTIFPDDDAVNIPDPHFRAPAEHLELRAHIEEKLPAAITELSCLFGKSVTIEALGNVLPSLLGTIMDGFDQRLSNPSSNRRRRKVPVVRYPRVGTPLESGVSPADLV